MYGKSNMETYITLCKIDSQWEFAVWLRKLKQGLCINLEGWDGKGGGIPRTEEPGGLPSMGSQKVRHDRSEEAACQPWEMCFPLG